MTLTKREVMVYEYVANVTEFIIPYILRCYIVAHPASGFVAFLFAQ